MLNKGYISIKNKTAKHYWIHNKKKSFDDSRNNRVSGPKPKFFSRHLISPRLKPMTELSYWLTKYESYANKKEHPLRHWFITLLIISVLNNVLSKQAITIFDLAAGV